jgi:hypothetical protein
MKYTIQYFRDGHLLGERAWWGHRGQVQGIAKDRLIIHDADIVRVLDESGKEAAEVRRMPIGPQGEIAPPM